VRHRRVGAAVGGQTEALKREACVRTQYWQQQGQKEEKLLSDLDAALLHFLGAATQANCDQVSWR